MTLWGVRPSVAVARGHWQAALDVDAMAGDPSVALGDVSTRLLAGTLAVGPRLSLGHLIVDVAACGRFGWAWMAGQTSDANAVASSGSAPFASAGGRLGIFLPTAAKVSHLRALVEAGAMIHGLDATVNGTDGGGPDRWLRSVRARLRREQIAPRSGWNGPPATPSVGHCAM